MELPSTSSSSRHDDEESSTNNPFSWTDGVSIENVVEDVDMTSPTQTLDESYDVGLDEADDDDDDDGANSEGISTATNTIYNVLLPTVCVFGIVGIVLTLVVLSRKTMRTSTNCYLIALSVADLIFLVLLGSMLAMEYLAAIEDSRAHSAIIIYGEYAKIVTNIALMASVWLTVTLAVERYVAICRPFLAPRLCTVRISIIVIVAVFVAATACRMPNFWENCVSWGRDTRDPTNSTYIAFMEWTALAYDPGYVTVYPWVVDGALTSVLPFVALVVLNASLVREVRRSTTYLQRHTVVVTNNTQQREELQISVMLIGIVVVFFICQTPYVVYSAVNGIRRGAMELTPGLLLFHRAAMLLLTLKSAVNFIIYCWFSEKFRATLKRVFRCVFVVVDGCCSRGNDLGGLHTEGDGNGFCCHLGRRCWTGGAVDGDRRRRETYCSVKMRTSAIQLTAI